MGDAKTNTITTLMAASATGFAARIDGILYIETACETRRHAIRQALARIGVAIMSSCDDPDCDCLEKAMAAAAGKLPARIEIVSVQVTVTE